MVSGCFNHQDTHLCTKTVIRVLLNMATVLGAQGLTYMQNYTFILWKVVLTVHSVAHQYTAYILQTDSKLTKNVSYFGGKMFLLLLS